MSKSHQYKSVQLCLCSEICSSQKPGILAIIFILVFLLKYRYVDFSWGEKTELNFPSSPDFRHLHIWKMSFKQASWCSSYIYILTILLRCITYQDPAHHTSTAILLLSFCLWVGTCFSPHSCHQGTLPWSIKVKLRFNHSRLIFSDHLLTET